jgi:hypothetical protein
MLPARVDRTTLLTALRERRRDRTLTTALPPVDPQDEQAVGTSGLPALDGRVGGLPRGHLSEIVGPRSSGRTSLLLHAMAAATRRGELVALVDALDMLDVESAAAAGVDLTRLLWIRGHVVVNPGLCRDLNQRAMEQAIRALGQALQAGNFGLVALDLADAPSEALKRLPFTTWLRLQRMIEGSQTIGVLTAREPVARSAAGLSIRLQPSDNAGARFAGRLFDGMDVEMRVSRARMQALDDTPVRAITRVACHV